MRSVLPLIHLTDVLNFLQLFVLGFKGVCLSERTVSHMPFSDHNSQQFRICKHSVSRPNAYDKNYPIFKSSTSFIMLYLAASSLVSPIALVKKICFLERKPSKTFVLPAR